MAGIDHPAVIGTDSGEELRSYEFRGLLTPKLLDSKLINSAFSVVNF
jgi:hypothetical protein